MYGGLYRSDLVANYWFGIRKFYSIKVGMNALRALFSHHAGCCSPLFDPRHDMFLQEVYPGKDGGMWEFSAIEGHERCDVFL